MKKLILVFVSLFSCFVLHAQKQDRVWVFDDSVGIDFNNLNSPTLFINNEHFSNENTACISDTSGNLLLYLNGYLSQNTSQWFLRLCNNSGNTIANGDTIFASSTETEGASIIPFPNNPNKYIVFTKQNYNASLIGFPYGLFYSVVDMNLNGGLGQVVIKNQPLLLNQWLAEKLSTVKNANGRDWWVVTHSSNGNTFIKYLVDPLGIHGPFYQSIGTFCDSINLFNIMGQMKFSKNGDKLTLVSDGSVCDVFDFDRCSGQFSNWVKLGDSTTAEGNRYYGCEFSPNGDLLYACNPFDNNNQQILYQWDLTSSNVQSSRIALWTLGGYPCIFGQMKLGPDGKIYFVNMEGYYWDSCAHAINVINSPDIVGAGCNVGHYQFHLGGYITHCGLPHMPNYNLGPLTGSPCDTLGIGIKELPQENFVMQVYPNPASEEINILFSKFISSGEVKITDITGREMRSKKLNHTNEIDFDISKLPAGIYFAEVKTHSGNAVKMFVKE